MVGIRTSVSNALNDAELPVTMNKQRHVNTILRRNVGETVATLLARLLSWRSHPESDVVGFDEEKQRSLIYAIDIIR